MSFIENCLLAQRAAPPDELRAWVHGTDWIRDGILEEWNRRGDAGSTTEAQEAQKGSDDTGNGDVGSISPKEDVGYSDKPPLGINASGGSAHKDNAA